MMITIRSECFLAFWILALDVSVIGAKAPIDTRIVGGTAADIADFPYAVQIWRGISFSCGGSLIGATFVLTAGHCGAGATAGQFVVVGGATRLTDFGVRRRVSEIIMHPNYNANTNDNDLAVFRLSRAMSGSKIAIIPLNTEPMIADIVGQVTGWGKTSESAIGPSIVLMTVQIPTISRKECDEQYAGILGITDSMFCAATESFDKDSCSGDSGGPFVYQGKLCGVTSWGNGCARDGYAGVYGDVGFNYLFIEGVISK